jgi:hypothetical protein
MKRILLGLAILAASTSYSQACGRFRCKGKQASANGTCTQQATQYQPVRGAIRAIVPTVYSAPNCTGPTCPR